MVRRRLPLAAVLAGLLLLGGSAYLSVHPAAPRGATARPAPATAPIIGADWFRTDASKAPVHHEGLRIKILGLGVDLPVVEGDGLTAPLYEAAHYPGMKWPGEGGRTLIYAHARAGMFGPLFGAHVGQQIQIARPDAPTLTYTIHEYHANWPSSNTDILQPSDHEQLVLLTCTTYNPADPRIVVVAEPAS